MQSGVIRFNKNFKKLKLNTLILKFLSRYSWDGENFAFESKVGDVGYGKYDFQQKKAKNTKVNEKINYRDKMHAKYGKPKTRGQKNKK